jgi:hypothetical protein
LCDWNNCVIGIWKIISLHIFSATKWFFIFYYSSSEWVNHVILVVKLGISIFPNNVTLLVYYVISILSFPESFIAVANGKYIMYIKRTVTQNAYPILMIGNLDLWLFLQYRKERKLNEWDVYLTFYLSINNKIYHSLNKTIHFYKIRK